MYMVDTSVLTRLRVSTVRSRLTELAPQGLARCSLTDLEIGYSADNGHHWDDLMGAVSAFQLIEMHTAHFTRAGQVQRLLAGRGLRGRPVPDLVIAAAAEAAGLTVLHYDADFDHIASVTGQPTEWIVPAGQIS